MTRSASGLRKATAAGFLLASLAMAASARGEGRPTATEATQGAAVAGQAREGVEGVASYYAKRFEGRRTTSGERYRADKLTAAHPKLPLGTRVRVIHLESGKEVVVKVNDRCRKKKVPFIDLSRAAARELGFLGKGIAKVRIVPLEKDLSEAEPAAQVAE